MLWDFENFAYGRQDGHPFLLHDGETCHAAQKWLEINIAKEKLSQTKKFYCFMGLKKYHL